MIPLEYQAKASPRAAWWIRLLWWLRGWRPKASPRELAECRRMIEEFEAKQRSTSHGGHK